MRTIIEDLNYAIQEPSENAAQKAKELDLTHVGFGRYEDAKTRQITHIAQNDTLVPYKKAVKTNSYRQTNSNDMNNLYNALSPEVQELLAGLAQTQPITLYDDAEISAVQYFIGSGYTEVNDRLAELPVAIPAKNIEPYGPDDDLPGIIAALDSAIKKSRTPEEYVVYTAIDPDGVENIQPNTTFRFKSFRNASVNLQSVIDPDDLETFILQIRLKKNARGLYTGELSETPEEGEIILPRGAKIEVLSGPTKLVGSDLDSIKSRRTIYYYDCVTKS